MRDKRPRGGRGAPSGACGRKQKGDAGMTLGEAKSEVLKLLDETKPKADLTGKMCIRDSCRSENRVDNKKGFRHAGIDHNFCQIARRERK